MDFRPKTELGSPPITNLKQMTISELVSVLRTAFRVDDFDRVEEVLVARDARLNSQIEEKTREIGSLKEKIEMQSMNKLNAEEQVKRWRELSEKGKRAQESYEKLLKEVKKSGLDDDKRTVDELRKRNLELEDEKRMLEEELKQNLQDDENAMYELKIINRELEEEKLKLEAEKKDWVDDRNNTIAELRAQYRRLADEKRKAESLVECGKKKLWELNERVLRMENDIKHLMSGDASALCGGNTEGLPFEAKEEREMSEMDVGFGNDTAGAASFQGNGHVRHSLGGGTKIASKTNKDDLGASARGTLGSETVIVIVDSDDEGCITQGALRGKEAASGIVVDNGHLISSVAVQQKILSKGVEASEMLKRKFASSCEFGTNINILGRIDTAKSSSSSDSSDSDNLPLSIRGIITSNKKRKTKADSLGLNPLPR